MQPHTSCGYKGEGSIVEDEYSDITIKVRYCIYT